MEGIRQGALPPVLAGLATGVLTLANARIPADGTDIGGAAVWWVPLALLSPFVVPVVWGWAWLTGSARRLTLAVAGTVLGLLLWRLPPEQAWIAASNVAAGLAAGWALGRRLRLDVAWLAVALCLAPPVMWSLFQFPVSEQFAASRDVLLQFLEDTTWAQLQEPELGRARAAASEQLDQAAALGMRTYPAFYAIGVLGWAGILLLAVFWLGRRAGRRPGLRGERSLARWRLPFYVVWCLVAGLGLLLTRAPYAATAGVNLVLLATLALSCQGLSVLVFFASRLLSGGMQAVFWLLMGFLLFPVLLALSLVLGLADQWIDTRRRWEAREIE